MKALLAMLFGFIPLHLFSQIDTKHLEEYKELIFNVQNEHSNSIGTAFVVGKNDSHYFLATAKHVLNGSREAILTSLDGGQYNASLVAEHDVHDLALVQTEFLPLQIDEVPIVIDIAMNDEVGFVSLKDRGKVLPSKGAGVVRDVTGESLSIIMKEVEQGHSGSPLISKDGIAGVIIKNGRFIECLNIMLVEEIVEEWGEGLFETVFVEVRSDRLKLVEPKSARNKEATNLRVAQVKSDRNLVDLDNLVDGKLGNVWTCSVDKGEAVDVWFVFEKLTSVRRFRIFISDDLPELLPRGYIFLADKENTVYASFLSILKHKERGRNGYWIVYELPKPELATEVTLYFSQAGTNKTSYYFNEIEFYGVAL